MIDLGSIPPFAFEVSPKSQVARLCNGGPVAHLDTPTANTASRRFVCASLHGSSSLLNTLRNALWRATTGDAPGRLGFPLATSTMRRAPISLRASSHRAISVRCVSRAKSHGTSPSVAAWVCRYRLVVSITGMRDRNELIVGGVTVNGDPTIAVRGAVTVCVVVGRCVTGVGDAPCNLIATISAAIRQTMATAPRMRRPRRRVPCT